LFQKYRRIYGGFGLISDCYMMHACMLYIPEVWICNYVGQETQELQKKQAWYQQNQISIQKGDEQDYLTYCSDAMFRIQILEQRLIRYIISTP